MDTNSNAEEEINALLADLWQRHLPTTRERLATLERAALKGSELRLTEAERTEAQSVAHKLSGNLGMFGHQLAGSVAGEIEQILKSPSEETLSSLVPLVQKLRQTLAPHLELST
jgi:HPt (histidine-containing phosphotransfer) domain-containing protein